MFKKKKDGSRKLAGSRVERKEKVVKAQQLRERKCWQSVRKKDRVRRYV